MHHPSREAINRRMSMPNSQLLAPRPALFHEAQSANTSTLLLTAAAVIFTLLLHAPATLAQANVQGTWQTVPSQMPINPVHTALMYNGKILVASGSGNYPAQTTFTAGVWDPSNNSFATQTLAWDVFCNGMVVLPDGRPFLMGGNLQYDPFHGWNRTAAYDPATGKFIDMEDMALGRWYPTSTVLSDGRVMTFSGLDENGNTNSQVEIYKVGVGWGGAATANWTPPLYPRLHLLPNGTVFYSGSSTQSRTFDPSTNSWSGVIATTNYGGGRTYGSSVLLPLTPANAYKPRVMILGGGNPSTATTEIIDLSAATPAWVNGPSMSQPRIEMNATLLPNGKVLAMGGSLNDEDTGTASLQADLYDSVSNMMSSAGSNAVPRLYHSVSLLLPDATVWVAGGNPQRGTFEPSVEIYTPPYLFKPDGTPATRPSISSVSPTVIGYGTSFQVQTPDAPNIASVVLMKNGASTHSFDMDQRMVGLNFTPGSGVLNVTGPPDGNTAPPGYYMLFIINTAGVPSVANFVRVSTAPTDIPPTGTITSPASDVSIAPGASVTFAATGSAPSGSIAGYSWSIRGATPATSSGPNPGAVTFPTAGTYTAVLTVTDNAGITDPSPETRTITVASAGTQPTLTGAAPASGAQGQANLNVALTGTNFATGATCNFGAGVNVSSCTFTSATQITANVNILANAVVGMRNVTVTNTDSQSATLTNGFSVTAAVAGPPPTLTSVTPNSEFQGATNVSVVLTGTNFQQSPTCTFDSDFGGTINTCTWNSATQITVNLTIASNATLGGRNVIVTNADGQSAKLINGFTVTEALGNTVKLGSGFTVGALVLNGNAKLNGSVLELTDGNTYQDASAWYATRVNVQNFVTDFTFQLTPGTSADGFTFALQSNSTAAIGVFGGGLGFGPVLPGDPGGIPNSVGVKFDLYDNLGEGVNSTGLYINGASPNIPAVDITPSGVNLHSGDTFAVHMTYDGTSLVMTLTDTVTKAVFTNTWPINIPATLGANTAYAGFTGGTGLLTAVQNILTWTLNPLASQVTFSPAGPVVFPDTTINTTSAPLTVTITNSGTTALHVTNATLTGINPADFAMTTNTCDGATLAPNATCTVGVTFTPSGTGVRQASLELADDASGSPHSLALSGTGTAQNAPLVTITPAGIILFPNTQQNATSAHIVATVTNSGTATVNITAVTVTGANAGDFAAASETCTGRPVAPTASCTLNMTFTPGAVGPRQATLQIADNASGSPQSASLSGIGAIPFTVTSPAAAFTATVTAGQAAQYSVQLTPGPGFSGTVTMACSGAPATTACTVANPIQLTAGTPTTFGVTVTTTARSVLLPYSNRQPVTPPAPYLMLIVASLCSAILAALYLSRARNVTHGKLAYSGALLLVLVAVGLAGCAGGGGSSPPGHTTGTQAGTYTLTLTPTTTNAAGKPMPQLPSQQLTLIVN